MGHCGKQNAKIDELLIRSRRTYVLISNRVEQGLNKQEGCQGSSRESLIVFHVISDPERTFNKTLG